MRSRRLVLGVLPLTIALTGCQVILLNGGLDAYMLSGALVDVIVGGPSNPGSLEGWHVTKLPSGLFQWTVQHLDCPTAFENHPQGASPSDPRPWVVGASVEVDALFQRPCGFFTKCLPLNTTYGTDNQNAWRILGTRVEAVGPGVGRIAASVDGEQFGEVELRAVAPDTIQVDRMLANAWQIPEAIEPLGNTALVTDGVVPITARLFDVSGIHLCGTPAVSATASGLTVMGAADTLAYPGLRANSVVTLQGGSTAGPATVTLSVDDASTTFEVDVVDVAAITGVEALLLDSYIRVRSLAGQQEVAGTLVLLENLTPNVYDMYDQADSVVTVLSTRAAAIAIAGHSTGSSVQGQVRLSVSGTAITPVVFEFTVP